MQSPVEPLSVRLPDQADGAAAGFTIKHELRPGDVTGTIGAHVEILDDWSYGHLSDNWVREQPLRHSENVREHDSVERVHAKDLIAELDIINAQVHRIMFQVERAVARLATSS